MTDNELIEYRGGPADGQIQRPPASPASFNSIAIGYQNGRAIYRRSNLDEAKDRWIFEYDEFATRVLGGKVQQ